MIFPDPVNTFSHFVTAAHCIKIPSQKNNLMRSNFIPALVLVATLITTVSCNKDDDSSSTDYYLQFKLDGTNKKYIEITTAVFTTVLPLYSCAMVGEKPITGNIYEGMGITISSDAEIVANVTYTDAIVASLGTPAASLLFTDEAGAQFASVIAVSPGVQVIISAMDANSVTGYFSGTVVSTADFTTSRTVTEGQFHLPRL